jgi:hypothetical protein
MAIAGLFIALIPWALGLIMLYWAIRLGVRHALMDVGVHRLVERTLVDSAADDQG